MHTIGPVRLGAGRRLQKGQRTQATDLRRNASGEPSMSANSPPRQGSRSVPTSTAIEGVLRFLAANIRPAGMWRARQDLNLRPLA